VFFEYPGNEPAIKAAASGDSSLRDYAWVVKNDPTENKEEFIRMIEEDKQQSSLVKSLVVHQLGEFELERGLENIYNMIEKIKLGNIGIEHFDSDRTRELVELILDRFSAVESKYKKWKENQ
ncbi:MAG: hypothetical protein VYE63_01220, partial [Candidatus Neomarinimicrobiota bacterium]|nr:hypothetical protein [Candidatus Neomarinimicrobiota bacterium]